MLSADEFITLVEARLARPNDEQRRCVKATESQPFLIIAGPATGKTTVMVLRALRHLLVDAMPPEQIVITTFTKKVAQEVRTRWLDWGLPLIEAARHLGTIRLAWDASNHYPNDCAACAFRDFCSKFPTSILDAP